MSPTHSKDSNDENNDDSIPQVEMTVAGSTDRHRRSRPVVADAAPRNFLHRFFYPHQNKDYNLGTSSGRDRGRQSNRRHARKRAERVATTEYDDDNNNESNKKTTGTNKLETAPTIPGRNNLEREDSSASGIEHTFDDRRNARQAGLVKDTVQSPDEVFVHNFWTTYDDILILSIFTQIGIIFRLASSSWFAYFDNVFSTESPLFVNLPLNCLSCFLMGLLCSGERLMEIIHTRFSPPRTQQDIVRDDSELYVNDDEEGDGLIAMDTVGSTDDDYDDSILSPRSTSASNSNHGLGIRQRLQQRRRRQRRRKKKEKQEHFISWQPPVHLNEELRDVQLLALERRIRMSKCLVLFPVKNEDIDVMEHYFDEGYKRDSDDEDDEEVVIRETLQQRQMNKLKQRRGEQFDDLVLEEEFSNHQDSDQQLANEVSAISKDESKKEETMNGNTDANNTSNENGKDNQIKDDPLTGSLERTERRKNRTNSENSETGQVLPENEQNVEENLHTSTDYITELTSNVHENVHENIERLKRVNLADGWDQGTTPEAMSDDLMLGLRDGFCGALSSFSSWNSSMVTLIRNGQVGEAMVGYMLGLQLPIIAYRFGQHIAVYIFVWRTRRETRKAERRGGYGIRLSMEEGSDREVTDYQDSDGESKDEDEVPSVRAIFTAIFIMALVTQFTSISFFDDPNDQQIALSLLFSPLGVLARWRLSKLNKWKPTFPIGTFTSNILACSLSGSLGTLLAGNPGPEERIVLVSFIAGFGGTLSSLATFIVEMLAGIDPILLRIDGVIYALGSLGAAFVAGLVFSASVEWADETRSIIDDSADTSG